MRVFNAFQITAMFAGLPFFTSWLSEQTFRGAGVAFWASIAAYAVAFAFMVGFTYEAIGD
jgi:hypothetical protein